MKRATTMLTLLLMATGAAVQAQTSAEWVLTESTLTYHISHPMHEVEGVSHAAKGKGACHGGMCDFLVAAPVNSFGTGDTNRDLHMVETTRGAQNPMVVVRARIAESTIGTASLHADLEVEFAGHTAHYAGVPLQVSAQGGEERISGTIPATCSDFGIVRPSFLTVPIKNEIPVRFEMTWRRGQ